MTLPGRLQCVAFGCVLRRTVLTAVLVLSATTAGWASTITESFVNSCHDTFDIGCILSSGLFPGFDPILGALDSVDLIVTATVAQEVRNEADVPLNGSPSAGLDLSFFAGALLLSTTSVNNVVLQPLETNAMFVVDMGGVSLTTNLSPFVSAGLVSFSADDGSSAFADDDRFTPASRAASLDGTVTYSYSPPGPTPVPEPASLSLLALGFAGMSALRVRQRLR